ncbi:ATP/GTP-binding protein [Nocardia nova]|uniref:ATP/GTP-binding protein n=1 Tax=Nocardia nova TaxID=37330 RepID=UPI0037A7AFD5
MLQSFRFGNHRSFRDEQQLNLMPVYPSDRRAGEGGLQPVSIVGIFGANASGKTNVIDALGYMQHLVLQSDRDVEPGAGLRRDTFRLVREAAFEPSRYVVDLLLSGERVTYGVTIDDTGVVEEWLYHYARTERYKNGGRMAVVFERSGEHFEWGPAYKGRKDLHAVSDITAPTALFLATAARFKIQSRKDVHAAPATDDLLHETYLWFNRVRIRRGNRGVSRWLGRFGGARGFQPFQDEHYRHQLETLLQIADFGIAGIDVVEGSAEARNAAKELEEAGKYSQAMAMREAGRDRLVFRHKGADRGVVLDLSDESRGTQQILDLGADAVRAIDRGYLLVVDEIDASLHPLISASLISVFREAPRGSRVPQLLFTSHDATLLGSLGGEEVLNRDEIWFTEKGDDGRSLLYSLAEFKPRKDGENRERRYLNGSYGAIPEISADPLLDALSMRVEENVEP